MTPKSVWIATRDGVCATLSKIMPRKYVGYAVAGVGLVLVGGLVWWLLARDKPLPDYLAKANGRLEMTRIDIAVKYPGRVVDLAFHEGDDVRRGAVLARQDGAEIRTQIAAAEALRQRALSTITRAEAELVARQNSRRLAWLEWSHTRTLRDQDLVSAVLLRRGDVYLFVDFDGF